MVVVYEVNLSVNKDIADQYSAWLKPHIAEILQLPGWCELLPIFFPLSSTMLSIASRKCLTLNSFPFLKGFLSAEWFGRKGNNTYKSPLILFRITKSYVL